VVHGRGLWSTYILLDLEIANDVASKSLVVEGQVIVDAFSSSNTLQIILSTVSYATKSSTWSKGQP
jgi:hypothetical protein